MIAAPFTIRMGAPTVGIPQDTMVLAYITEMLRVGNHILISIQLIKGKAGPIASYKMARAIVFTGFKGDLYALFRLFWKLGKMGRTRRF